MMKRWSRRFFVLEVEDCRLLYRQHRDSKVMRGEIPLRGGMVGLLQRNDAQLVADLSRSLPRDKAVIVAEALSARSRDNATRQFSVFSDAAAEPVPDAARRLVKAVRRAGKPLPTDAAGRRFRARVRRKGSGAGASPPAPPTAGPGGER